MKTDEELVVVEQDFKRSIADVWSAITDIEKMGNWYFDNIPDFKAELGFRTQFMVQSGEREFLHLWEVTEVIPEKRLVYNWKYEGYAGASFVSFELSQNGQSTGLRVACHVVEDFSDEIPEFRRESCVGGWTYFIKDRLKIYLDG